MATVAAAAFAAVTMEHDKTPTTCKPHHSTLETSLSLFLCLGLVVSYLPQYVRIIVNRSSVGFSPWFLFLGATSSASSFLNVVSLQWAIVSCCQWLSTGACAESLLGIVQVGLQWFLFTGVFTLFLIYYPVALRYERTIALGGTERGLLAYDGEEGEVSSSSDLDSVDSHIADNYADQSPSGLAVEGAEVSGLSARTDDSAGDSALQSRLDVDSDDERSSSAFSRLVPTFWPVWKAPPRKYAPSPLSKISATDGLPPNATREASFAANAAQQQPSSAAGSAQASGAATPAAAVDNDGDSAHVRIHAPPVLRKPRRRHIKTRSPEWALAMSLAWLTAFYCIFILLVTLLLVLSLPANSFPSPPAEPSFDAMGPSSRLLVNRWAAFLGWSAMILAALQYLPQIVHTSRNKLVGSLSIPTLCLQVPGSAIFVYSLALRPGVNWTSLAAYVCSGSLQAVLLGLCIAWRVRQRRHGVDDYGRPLVSVVGRAASEAPSG